MHILVVAKQLLKKAERILFIMLLFIANAVTVSAQINAPDSPRDTLLNRSNGYNVNHPSSWIQKHLNQLNNLDNRIIPEIDTSQMLISIHKLATTSTLIANDFHHHQHNLTLRTIYDYKMEMERIIELLGKWRNQIRKLNDEYVSRTLELEDITREIIYFKENADSLVQKAYLGEVENLGKRKDDISKKALQTLMKYTRLEDTVNRVNNEMSTLLNNINSTYKQREQFLLHKELPPIWASTQKDYRGTFFSTVKNTLHQTFQTIQFYTSTSLVRLVLFRLFIFTICLFPLKLFNKKKPLHTTDLNYRNLTYLHKYPSLASSIMGLSLAPLIFVHPPHAFLELLFITLTASTGWLIYKEHPYINKKAFFALIGSFLMLYLINFFITPTFTGRILFSLSIFLLIPLYTFYKELPSYPVKRPQLLKGFLLFMSVNIFLGWLGTIGGNYTMGKALTLAAFDTIILALILHIAVFVILDYIIIITVLINKNHGTLSINSSYIYEKLKPLFIFTAVIALIISYLKNINVYNNLQLSINSVLMQPRTLGNTTFNYNSVVLFLLSVFLAFFLAGILRYTFHTPDKQQNMQRRSNAGSYLLLIRFMLICTGFVVGMLASGMQFSDFTVVIGALSLGIGFGLQHIVGNLVSGLIIVFEKPFLVGDLLELQNEAGWVKEIGLRATRITTSEGAEIMVPNGKLLSEDLKNWTLTNDQRRIEILLPIDQSADPALAIDLINQVLAHTSHVSKTLHSSVQLSAITDEALQVTIHFWVDNIKQSSSVKDQVLLNIHSLFKEHQISYPKRDMVITKNN